MPRTAGLRTLSELTTSLTKAGLDPSRIQERAEMLAKVQGAKRKRERDEEDAEMDVDGEGESGEEGEGDWMDVDDGSAPAKRVKTNSGAAAVNRRAPKSNRQLAGMRDDAVSCSVRFNARCTVLTKCVRCVASCQGDQATEPGPERTQLPGEGRRGRSRYQNKDGESLSRT